MELKEIFPIWEKLTDSEQAELNRCAVLKKFPRGTIVHRGNMDCMGLLVVCSGQLRAYFLSDEGREVTLYRLFEMDMCLFSASCAMKSIQFEVIIQAEKDSQVWIIPPFVYKKVMEESAPLANYTNEIMAARFSEVMWLIEQIMWKSFDKRLAGFLLEETALEQTNVLKLTHETIANHLGTAREVVTRMLRYFRSEGMVKLTRGSIEVLDRKRLEQLQES